MIVRHNFALRSRSAESMPMQIESKSFSKPFQDRLGLINTEDNCSLR